MKYTRIITAEVERPYTVCDKCEKEITIKGDETFDFQFECRKGTIYSDHSFGVQHNLDLCQECSDDLIRLLEFEGFALRKREYDF